MKSYATLLALFLAPVTVWSGDFQVTADRERAEKTEKVKAEKTASGIEKVIYNIKVRNNSLKPSAELKVEYIIFVERQELGGKGTGTEPLEKLKGAGSIKSLVPRSEDGFKTPEVSLRDQSLVSGWHYKSGGRTNAKDRIKGVWVKLLDGTAVVGEFVEPATIKSEQKW